MKRYLLFCGRVYYPSGGIRDLVGDFDSVNAAEAAAADWVKAEDCDATGEHTWWHILDLMTRAVVKVRWRGEEKTPEVLPDSDNPEAVPDSRIIHRVDLVRALDDQQMIDDKEQTIVSGDVDDVVFALRDMGFTVR